ncbi:uncharacterized protein BJ171DRAFT_17192 [Polychytrium aggregatum]|uniref:uncharacterized protein n=1 Tax=Polychytrium aggregatum TaxID=110093 RepID=UPI0022FEFE26|nr:uncharacterized protein BJ171DRAFT_17192 [Polychytrium aggregatum]KAI9206681.1 hypothetical protein BJ171DRAFT_17192 [Polychytrium aggregatum]
MADKAKLDVLMCGTGEYTTGYVHGSAADSDKKIGVVGLVMFDMRQRGHIGRLAMVGTTGSKNQGIREHLKAKIEAVYRGLDTSLEIYPPDDVDRDIAAYKAAIDSMAPGGAVTIFTPDDTHFEIAAYAIQHRLHVLIAKPAVKTLKEHQILADLAAEHNVLCVIEFHKRFDPIYSDARERIRALGDFSYFDAYMSQPKHQLQTFKSWAGKSSDISYYLNSHHIDLHVWSLKGIAYPFRVMASSAAGVAESQGCVAGTEDTITLIVQWKNIASGSPGTAIYTSSWIAPKAEVHSQQRFFYMGHKGEVRIDQAHRGYELATDAGGYASVNPLFMRYTPDGAGRYAGQLGYGHRSIEEWAQACIRLNQGTTQPSDYDGVLSTIADTRVVTAILEAGRQSLDNGSCWVDLPQF